MAGDWIKMEVGLPDKPEVWRMSGMLQVTPDDVVGKLLRVWGWFDTHTENGNAVGVSFSLVDRVAGVAGFAEAMQMTGWLEQNGHALTLPKFGRHNGKTAKNRALTNERVANHRALSNAEGNADSVTKTVTREEKRREEKKRESAQPANRGQRLPPGWTPEPVHMAFAESLGLRNGKAAAELDKFRDYWSAQPGQKGVKTDWPATWRNWVRRAAETTGGGASAAPDPFEGAH